MDLDTFFDECDHVMGSSQVPTAQQESAVVVSDSLELMDIFSLMDNMDTSQEVQGAPGVMGSTPTSPSATSELMKEHAVPEGVTLSNTMIQIKPQSSSSLSEYMSIKEMVTAYFDKYGVSNTEVDFIQYVDTAFNKMFPYCKKCDTYLKKLQSILIWGYNVGLTLEAIEMIGISTKLKYQNLKLNRRLVGYAEFPLLQSASEQELEFIRRFSLTEKTTSFLLELYRKEGEEGVEYIKPYLFDKDIFEYYIEMSNMSGFQEDAFKAAMEQQCLTAYKDSLKSGDIIMQTLIMNKSYNKVKGSLKELDKHTLDSYADFHYLETVITLLDSGFSNKSLIHQYLKEENEIGDFLSKSYDMQMLKLLNQGQDVHYAILAKLYTMNSLNITSSEFEGNKSKFVDIAIAYIRNQLSIEDVMLQTVMLLKNPEANIEFDVPIREAVFNYILKDLVVINSSVLSNSSNPPEVYQLVLGKSSYVFNVYDFCNHNADVEHTLTLFTDKRKNVKLYRTTPEICVIAFGNEGGTNFISEDRHYSCSLKNWCKGSYDKTKTYTITSLCEINGLTVLEKYQQNFNITQEDYQKTESWLNELYNSSFAYKIDLVMDYLLRNPKSLSLLISDYRQAGIAALSRVLDLSGFNQAFYFLHVLIKGVCNKEPKCSFRTQRQPSRAEIIIRSKRYGNKLCTFDTIFAETTFHLLMNELKNAKNVKLSYVNSIIIECEE